MRISAFHEIEMNASVLNISGIGSINWGDNAPTVDMYGYATEDYVGEAMTDMLSQHIANYH